MMRYTKPIDYKESAKGALTALPYAYGAATSNLPGRFKALSFLSPAVTGLSEAGIGLLEGKSLKQSGARGVN